MKFLLFIVFIFTIFALTSYADEFNSYRWNRENVLNNSSEVDRKPWFEWWYYKVVLPETGESFFFVYGVVNPWDSANSLKGTRAYVGMGDFVQKKQIEETLDISQFNARYDETYVTVGNQFATDTHFNGNINNQHGQAYWNINIQKKWTFNAISWATGRGITNIEWYPAQADAVCSGTIVSGGVEREFQKAPCYQDRNWGESFPKWWTWIVSNHFVGHPDTALAIGGGKPKYWGHNIPFEGVAIGLKHKGKEYNFRPNEFDRVRVDINFGKWNVYATNGKHKVVISAWAPPESFMDLKFMTPEGEIFHDYETLTGYLKVELYKKKGFFGWKLMETLESYYAGIEYGSRDEFENKGLFYGQKTLFNNF